MGHYYTKSGEPMYFVPKANGQGTRPTNKTDAAKLDLIPGVTEVLKCLDKPALNTWIARQAALVVLTAPRKDGEDLDAFVTRVLDTEQQQDQEAAQARDRGTEIHSAIELVLHGRSLEVSQGLRQWIDKPCVEIVKRGIVIATEAILVGNGYAGKTDVILDCDGDVRHQLLVDIKTCKTLPTKGAWPEHRLQLSAYAAARNRGFFTWNERYRAISEYTETVNHPVRTANLYISTKIPGEIAWFDNPPWEADYECFKAVLKVWSHLNHWENGK